MLLCRHINSKFYSADFSAESPKSTLGAVEIASSLATLKLGLVSIPNTFAVMLVGN